MINESKKVGKKVTNLVVCPTSLTYNWLSEIQNFFTEVKAAVIDGIDRLAILDQASDYDILIINYEKVGKCLSKLQGVDMFYLVLDEAHKIKNAKSVIA